MLVPEETIGAGAENLFKTGEAKGTDQRALERRNGAIINGIRPTIFKGRGWSRGKWKPVKASAFERFGAAKELEYAVRTALIRIEHQPVGQDYFLGDAEQAIDVAIRVMALLERTADAARHPTLSRPLVPGRAPFMRFGPSTSKPNTRGNNRLMDSSPLRTRLDLCPEPP